MLSRVGARGCRELRRNRRGPIPKYLDRCRAAALSAGSSGSSAKRIDAIFGLISMMALEIRLADRVSDGGRKTERVGWDSPLT
jgi:hypothetical protein